MIDCTRPHHRKTSYGGHTCLLIMSEVATVTKGGGAYRTLWKGLFKIKT